MLLSCCFRYTFSPSTLFTLIPSARPPLNINLFFQTNFPSLSFLCHTALTSSMLLTSYMHEDLQQFTPHWTSSQVLRLEFKKVAKPTATVLFLTHPSRFWDSLNQLVNSHPRSATTSLPPLLLPLLPLPPLLPSPPPLPFVPRSTCLSPLLSILICHRNCCWGISSSGIHRTINTR